ncbi:YciI-like protein [uncultured Hyphomicrobium sp.]|uniref:YciI-like protein n=1 Tax=uncultured Hyphomicrobium sp. TaxID=194373 RepID=UPI0025E3E350|nr:YciI-like protein [uncultured Hyphomicrobium sp.]
MHYVLFYDYVPDYLERRGPLREAHFALASIAIERGELFLGGAFAGPADGAMIVFSGSSPAVAENFARADPYVAQGLVTRWWVREWTTVVGKDAANPLTRPATA